ncbi:hypothetical protein MA16_Dca027561 [Dendrobium catenatum]|uniref:Uncharacterized protein n=1 Tax=Dendrobium catenatum TaxID=906689 RepID=A0A2I0XIX8_9ASPA|nr:hypothetical protein MA16_Dca027561 [Dendrobium catenatum]
MVRLNYGIWRWSGGITVIGGVLEKQRCHVVVLQNNGGVPAELQRQVVVRWNNSIRQWSSGTTVSGVVRVELRRQVVVRWKYGGRWWSDGTTTSVGGLVEQRHQAVVRRNNSVRWWTG